MTRPYTSRSGQARHTPNVVNFDCFHLLIPIVRAVVRHLEVRSEPSAAINCGAEAGRLAGPHHFALVRSGIVDQPHGLADGHLSDLQKYPPSQSESTSRFLACSLSNTLRDRAR